MARRARFDRCSDVRGATPFRASKGCLVMRKIGAILGITALAAVVFSPLPAAASDLPVQRIEQVVQPTAQQQSAFNDLKKAAQNASDQLQSSCPSAVPKSPVARVDTVEARLTAMT